MPTIPTEKDMSTEGAQKAVRRSIGVVAILPPHIRHQLDAAIGEHQALHVDTVEDACRAVAINCPQLLLIAPSMLVKERPAAIRQLLRHTAGALPVAMIGASARFAPPRLLDLGACGVRSCLDLDDRDVWRKVRELASQREDTVATAILRRIARDVGEVSLGLQNCLDDIVRLAPRTTTVTQLAREFAIKPSTFVSRFVRAGLPSPKRYLVATRLLYVSALFDQEDMTVGNVAYRLRYASPQSLGRHLRIELGITPSEFRHRHPFNARLDAFSNALIQPYKDSLRAFDPLSDARR